MSKIKLILVAVLLTGAIVTCGGNEDTVGPASMDRDKFIGNWAGTYECSSSPPDTMFIANGSGDLDFRITLHAHIAFADVVTAELTGPNTITIPEQTIGFSRVQVKLLFPTIDCRWCKRGWVSLAGVQIM